MRKLWTDEECAIIKEHYPFKETIELLPLLPDRSVGKIYRKAHSLGIAKDPEYYLAYLRKQMKEVEQKGLSNRYQKGSVPKNKGKKIPQEVLQKNRHTFFKPGHIPHNTKYDGYERLSKEGYIEVRVRRGIFRLKHRVVYEQHYGPIPKGHVVVFKDRNKLNVVPENLECISKEENMFRNSSHKYPSEVIPSLVLNSKLKKIIKQKSKTK